MFSWFIEGVEALDSLIGKPRKRDRFVEVVLAKTEHYAEGKVLFRSFSATLYRERWGEVASYLRQAWPLLRFLRQFWDQVAYESGDSEREDQANLAKLTKLLRDDVFFVCLTSSGRREGSNVAKPLKYPGSSLVVVGGLG